MGVPRTHQCRINTVIVGSCSPVITQAVTTAMILISGLPLLLTLLPPRATTPYPPYMPPYIAYVCALLEPDEVLCTDIPEATAWYGDRASIQLPQTMDEFYAIHDFRYTISGLYLTPVTGNKPYHSILRQGREQDWFPLLEQQIPTDFPLTEGITLPPGQRDQLFLTDRVRW